MSSDDCKDVLERWFRDNQEKIDSIDQHDSGMVEINLEGGCRFDIRLGRSYSRAWINISGDHDE